MSNPVFKDCFKIGITDNVLKRLLSYQTGDPNRGYKLEFTIPVIDPSYKESQVLYKLRENVKYEWIIGLDIKTILETLQNI